MCCTLLEINVLIQLFLFLYRVHTVPSVEHFTNFFFIVQDDNLRDVLSMLIQLMNDHPASLVPAFDSKVGAHRYLDPE